jgi:hypothetical protein
MWDRLGKWDHFPALSCKRGHLMSSYPLLETVRVPTAHSNHPRTESTEMENLVSSDSTVKLITKAVVELKTDPKIGRAEALRRSMLYMITTGKDYEAHPAFWAPFVIVGEGGAGK